MLILNSDQLRLKNIKNLVDIHGLVLLRGFLKPLDEAELNGLVTQHFGARQLRFRKLGNSQGSLLCKTGLEWHSDGHACYTVLHCHKTPQRGGDTLFTSSYGILDRLDDEIRKIAEQCIAVYGNRYTFCKGSPSAVDCNKGLRMNETGTKLLKPVRNWATNPEKDDSTFSMPLIEYDEYGRGFLVLDIRHFIQFEGWEVDASRRFLDTLLKMGLLPIKQSKLDYRTLLAVDDTAEFDANCVYRHKWMPNDLMIWDNNQVRLSQQRSVPRTTRGFARITKKRKPISEAAPPPSEMTEYHAWSPVTDKTSGQVYWWNKQTNETTALGAPRPEGTAVGYQQPTLGQTMKEGVAWGVGMGVGRAVVGSVFGSMFGGDEGGGSSEGGNDGGDGWI